MKGARLVAQVREGNRQAAGAWHRWAPHRSHVMAVLGQLPADQRRLCLLGAGHLHDVEMTALVEPDREITLVDVDHRAVTATVARSRERVRTACRVAPATDLTGVLHLLDPESAHPPGTEQVIAALAAHRTEVAGAPFDATVSLGVLTQLLQAVVDAGLAGDDVARATLALRDKHLRDLVRLTRPGGTCVLVTDVVSSSTAPQLLGADAADLELEMARVVAARNFFTGVNPYRIVAVLEEDATLRDHLVGVRLCDPWLWAVTPDRQHLTCAIVATRRS